MSVNHTYKEKELLLRIAEGDERAFKELFSIYIPFLLPTVLKLVKESSIADDILQEVFMRIWLYRDKLPLVESPRSWVLKIAYNRVFSYKAGQEKYSFHLRRIADGQARTSQETEEELAYQGLKRLLGEAVERLPPQQRKVYQLSRDNGMSLQQVADYLDLSIQTVKNTLGKAMQSIRVYIEVAGDPASLVLIFLSTFF